MTAALEHLKAAIKTSNDRVTLTRLAIAACGRLQDPTKAAALIDEFAAMAEQLPAAPGGDEIVRQHLQDIATRIARA